MFHRYRVLGITLFLMLTTTPAAWAEVIRVTLLQLNDVYEITPVEGGRRGGLARVATLRNQLLAENPHTYTMLAGDLISPSALGTARVNGERLAGAQIVATMNTLGLDFATFGNHEFDVSAEQFLARLAESEFQWLSGNVSQADGQPFPNVPRSTIVTISGAGGEQVRIGLVSATLVSNERDYVQYQDPIQALQDQVETLNPQVDILVALTHLSLAQDQQVVAVIPDIDLILGGHEHENIQQWRFDPVSDHPPGCEEQPTPIFKADANARTVYIHDLFYDTETRCLTITSRLQPITAALPEDPRTAATVQQWQERGFAGFRASGFNPEETVAVSTLPLDGLEASVRNHPTELTDLIATAMLEAAPDADLALFNSGSIRIDDVVPPGPITQYDVIRMLPFGGKILTVDLPGDLLARVLSQGQTNRGTGGFLQTANVSWDDSHNIWQVQGEPLNPNHTYRVAINDFLISGRETGLDYLTLDAPGVSLMAEGDDIRFAVIKELQRTAGLTR
jgi:5'-nucleotidase/UDP-sugar diphosphatase